MLSYSYSVFLLLPARAFVFIQNILKYGQLAELDCKLAVSRLSHIVVLHRFSGDICIFCSRHSSSWFHV